MSEIVGTWSEVEIAGKRADIYEPLQTATDGRVILHLHGHGLETLKDNVAFSAELERYSFRAICPHGQRSWWTDTVCNEFDPKITPLAFLRTHVLKWIESRWDVRPPAVGLMGISMGGQGALQLAYRHPREFPVVAAISPAVDFHNWYGEGLPLDEMYSSKEAARQQTATLYVHPLNWPRHQLLVCDPVDEVWFEGVERLAMKLSSSGIMFESDFSSSRDGHCWDYFNLMAPKVLEFISARLEQESRRE